MPLLLGVVDELPVVLLLGKGLTGPLPDELTLLLGVPPRIPRPYSKASVSNASISKASKIHPHFPHRNSPSSLYLRSPTCPAPTVAELFWT